MSESLARKSSGKERVQWGIFCPGCRHSHMMGVGNPSGSNWDFNGNVLKPTFTPSVRVSVGGHGSDMAERTLCHSWVSEGRINFLNDSSGHALRDWHDLIPFPEGYGGIE